MGAAAALASRNVIQPARSSVGSPLAHRHRKSSFRPPIRSPAISLPSISFLPPSERSPVSVPPRRFFSVAVCFSARSVKRVRCALRMSARRERGNGSVCTAPPRAVAGEMHSVRISFFKIAARRLSMGRDRPRNAAVLNSVCEAISFAEIFSRGGRRLPFLFDNYTPRCEERRRRGRLFPTFKHPTVLSYSQADFNRALITSRGTREGVICLSIVLTSAVNMNWEIA